MPLFTGLALAAALSSQATAEDGLAPLIRLQDYLPFMTERDHKAHGNGRDFVQAGAEDALSITPPQVEMAASGMTATSLSIAFNWVWLGEGEQARPVWFARLRAAQFDRSIERFADSRDCPAVEQALAKLDALPTLDPRIPKLPDGTPGLGDFGGYLHDNTYTVRLRGLFEGGTYTDRLEVTGGSTAPFAWIIGDNLRNLLPCWTETPPPRA